MGLEYSILFTQFSPLNIPNHLNSVHTFKSECLSSLKRKQNEKGITIEEDMCKVSKFKYQLLMHSKRCESIKWHDEIILKIDLPIK
jgi:hypothetical protein